MLHVRVSAPGVPMQVAPVAVESQQPVHMDAHLPTTLQLEIETDILSAAMALQFQFPPPPVVQSVNILDAISAPVWPASLEEISALQPRRLHNKGLSTAGRHCKEQTNLPYPT